MDSVCESVHLEIKLLLTLAPTLLNFAKQCLLCGHEAHVDLDLGPVENPTGNSTPLTLVGAPSCPWGWLG